MSIELNSSVPVVDCDTSAWGTFIKVPSSLYYGWYHVTHCSQSFSLLNTWKAYHYGYELKQFSTDMLLMHKAKSKIKAMMHKAKAKLDTHRNTGLGQSQGWWITPKESMVILFLNFRTPASLTYERVKQAFEIWYTDQTSHVISTTISVSTFNLVKTIQQWRSQMTVNCFITQTIDCADY